MTNLEKIQEAVGTLVDNDWGPKTQKAVSRALNIDPNSTVSEIQEHVGSYPDGLVGRNTFSAILTALDVSEVESTSSDLASLIVELASKEVGTREHGRNTGPKVREYQSADWLDGTGYAWCASFVCYIVRKAGEQIPLKFKRPRTAGAWDMLRWAKDQGLRINRNPKRVRAGDIVVFTFSHVGIAASDSSGGYVKTIEGNTNQAGSREGDGVYRKTRRLSLIKGAISLD